MSDSKHFVSAARVVSSLTFVSRLLGLARDMTCAAVFGAGGMWAAFSVAFMVPNLFRRLFGEGALSSAFIPVFSHVRHLGDEERTRRLAGTVIAAMSLLLVALIVLGEGLVLGLDVLSAPTPRNETTLWLTGLMLPFALLVCVVAVLGGLLNVLGHFAAPAGAPVLLNISMITAAGVSVLVPGLSPEMRLTILAGGVMVAGVLELLLQLVALRFCGFHLKLSLDLRDEAVRRIALLTGPMVLGLAVVQINALADSLIAYLFVPYEGAPGMLYYAQRLYQFPEGVFLTAIATAIYPQFSLMAARSDFEGFGDSVGRGLRMVVFIGLPASVGLILIGEPLVGLCFERRAFTHYDTIRTAATLAFYAGGIWAYGLQMMLSRAFYALQDSKTPVRIAVYMVVLNFTMNLTLVHIMPEPQERGVALATAICAAIQSVWLATLLARRVGHIDWRGLTGHSVRVVVATAAMAIACLLVGPRLGGRFAIQVMGTLAVGMAVFIGLSWVLRIEELKDLLLHRRR